jgi:hypothetical protein
MTEHVIIICNVRDMSQFPPVDRSRERRAEYFNWAKQVVDRIRGASPILETLFDEALARRNDTRVCTGTGRNGMVVVNGADHRD